MGAANLPFLADDKLRGANAGIRLHFEYNARDDREMTSALRSKHGLDWGWLSTAPRGPTIKQMESP